MTEERPGDDIEPTQAQLDLDEPTAASTPYTNGESKPPDDAPPDDPPPDYPLPEDGPPPETTNLLGRDDDSDVTVLPNAELEEDDEPQSEFDDGEPLAALGEADDDPDETVDGEEFEEPALEDLMAPEDEEGETAFAPPAAAAAASTPAFPTSWPDPIPVGEAPVQETRFQGTKITPGIVILGSLTTLIFLLFVTIEPTPRWLLLFGAIVAALGTDGVLRQAWPRFFASSDPDADSTPYLFLPALAAIAWPMLIEHNVRGYLVLPAALLAGAAFTAVLIAQVSSVRVSAPVYPFARLVSTAAVYFSAFALFSLSYVLDVELPAAVAAVAVVAAMLGVELFREGQVDPLETLVFSGVAGIILAEARWAMYYVPIGGYLAGLALLLGFFLITGLLHSHLTRRLNNVVALEYGGIAAAGVLLVTIAAQAGLG